MDESAIRLIQETAISAYNGKQERMPVDTIALPENYKIHSIEKFQPERNRFRGIMSTASLSDFVSYVKSADQPHPHGYIDADAMAACVFFNLITSEGAPGHADWRSVLTMKKTAAYAAMRAIEGKALTQRDLIEWIEDWNRNIVALNDAGEPINTGLAIQAIRKIELKGKTESTHEEGNRRASRTALEEIEAAANSNTPDIIQFDCEPYLGLPARVFSLRVSVLTNHEDPRLKLRIAAKEEHEEGIAQDFKSALFRDLDGAAKLFVGSFNPDPRMPL